MYVSVQAHAVSHQDLHQSSYLWIYQITVRTLRLRPRELKHQQADLSYKWHCFEEILIKLKRSSSNRVFICALKLL